MNQVMKYKGFMSLISILLLLFAKGYSQEITNDRFKDCDFCPEMMVIPPGSVYIGSYEEEIGRKRGERIRTEATIEQAFALGKTEVTLAQYREFILDSDHQSTIPQRDGKDLIGCNYFDGKSYGYVAAHSWENPGYPQREDAPVVCVSWSDAQAYAEWLTKKTGRTYRIPSSVEFEYASRAGSSNPWYWGTDPTQACEYANIGVRSFVEKYPSRPSFPCEDGYVYTASVGKFKPNSFGLHDMVGNAWEWTNDCFELDLKNAPTNGSSGEGSETSDCDFRTPKGGSWISGISWSRAAVRSRDHKDYKSFMLGFRVAAEIEKGK